MRYDCFLEHVVFHHSFTPLQAWNSGEARRNTLLAVLRPLELDQEVARADFEYQTALKAASRSYKRAAHLSHCIALFSGLAAAVTRHDTSVDPAKAIAESERIILDALLDPAMPLSDGRTTEGYGLEGFGDEGRTMLLEGLKRMVPPIAKCYRRAAQLQESIELLQRFKEVVLNM